MNDQISAELLKLPQNVDGAASGTVEIIKQQFPELCHQIIVWEMTSRFTGMIISLLVVFLGVWLIKHYEAEALEGKSNFNVCTPWIVGFLMILICGIVAGADLFYGMKAIVAPDLVILTAIGDIL